MNYLTKPRTIINGDGNLIDDGCREAKSHPWRDARQNYHHAQEQL